LSDVIYIDTQSFSIYTVKINSFLYTDNLIGILS